MEKIKIEDYLHLYLGCKFVTGNSQGEVNSRKITVIYGMLSDKIYNNFWLVLRPLSDMTEEERADIWDIVFKKIFVPRYSGRTVFIVKSKKKEISRWVMNSGVERLGIEFNGDVWADSDLHKWDFNPHEVTKYLLSKSFDLFGLIEAGLAIDKTKLPK